ncbi:hypothetical protein HanPSC8_Chr09g0365331 [Helianthus annuus]|nr:hypothetical protein HanPSC8_Chr09g0365331 [Helianthus annuus]
MSKKKIKKKKNKQTNEKGNSSNCQIYVDIFDKSIVRKKYLVLWSKSVSGQWV